MRFFLLFALLTFGWSVAPLEASLVNVIFEGSISIGNLDDGSGAVDQTGQGFTATFTLPDSLVSDANGNFGIDDNVPIVFIIDGIAVPLSVDNNFVSDLSFFGGSFASIGSNNAPFLFVAGEQSPSNQINFVNQNLQPFSTVTLATVDSSVPVGITFNSSQYAVVDQQLVLEVATVRAVSVAIPEPATMGIVGFAALGLSVRRRRA